MCRVRGEEEQRSFVPLGNTVPLFMLAYSLELLHGTTQIAKVRAEFVCELLKQHISMHSKCYVM